MNNYTNIDVQLDPNEEYIRHFQKSDPIFVAFFPFIYSDDELTILDYCHEKVRLLTELLTLNRHATGQIFSSLLLHNNTGEVKLYPEVDHYRGNMLTGFLAGEQPASIANKYNVIAENKLSRYFVSLYNNASNETNESFEFLRYWTVLESIAESKNYNHNEHLVDQYENYVTDDNGNQLSLDNNIKREVCQLIFDFGIRLNIEDENEFEYNLYNYIVKWHAFRHAAAHFGGFDPDSTVQENNFDHFDKCLEAYSLQGNQIGGEILNRLRNYTWLVINKEISSELN